MPWWWASWSVSAPRSLGTWRKAADARVVPADRGRPRLRDGILGWYRFQQSAGLVEELQMPIGTTSDAGSSRSHSRRTRALSTLAVSALLVGTVGAGAANAQS